MSNLLGIIAFFFLISPLIDARRSGPPLFVNPTETEDLNCARFMEQTVLNADGTNRNEDLAEYRQNRVIYPDTEDWNSFKMDCESIFTRTYYQLDELYPEEREFPIAFARTVYKDYRLVEMELASTYAPQNHYCYALDANASPMFHARMKSLANCFPNVYLTQHEYIMDNQGHNVSQSDLECLKLLTNPSYKWEYVVSMQNHDICLKTNQELIQVFQWLNGTNDMLMQKVPEERINPSVDWSFEALRLFKNDSRNKERFRGFDPRMTLAKSYSTVSLSRAAVDFIANELQLDPLLKALEWREWGTNELFLGSLDTADAVGLPGGFTSHCLQEDTPDYFISRYTIFKGSYCATEFWRNDMCIFGMEHLSEFQYSPFLFANKFQPDKDFGSVACWHQYMFNRTHLERGTLRLDPKRYTNAPHVRFNRQLKEEGDSFNPKYFNCQSLAVERELSVIVGLFSVFVLNLL